MATITIINGSGLIKNDRAVLNTNFANLNTDKVDGAAALTTAGRLVEVASSGVATQTFFAASAVLLSTGTYSDPAWLTALATTKLTGTLQAAQFPALTGDVTTSAGAVDTTLANTAVTPGSYGSATQVATFTVDAKGRLTAAASTSIAIAASQVTSGTLAIAQGGTGAATLAGAGIVVGSASLTTANALPIVASAGTLGQSDVSLASGIFSRAGTLGLSATGANVITFSTNGTERGRWSSGGNLLVGTTTDAGENLQVVGATNVSTRFSAASGNYSSGFSLISGAGGGSGDHAYLTMAKLGAATSGWIVAGVWNGSDNLQIINPSDFAAKLTLFKSTNNLVVGAATDGNYRLDVGSSGSTGTAQFYDQTATTGVTQVVVRAGAGQSTTALQTWADNAGGTLALIDANGGFGASASGVRLAAVSGNQMVMTQDTSGTGTTLAAWYSTGLTKIASYSSATVLSWSNSSSAALSGDDIGLARNAAGIIEVNNGSAGTYRDIIARSYIGTAVAAATLANSQFTFHLASNTELVVTAKGSDGTTRSVTLTLA